MAFGLSDYERAIAQVESGGKYGILGPRTRSGDQAYGKYQVMGNNVGPWTKDALGYAMTPQQFLSDPAAQDTVFRHRFGSYLAKGNGDDAVSMWFSGRPMAKAGNASDGYNTVPQYVSKVNGALGAPTNEGSNMTPMMAAMQRGAPGRTRLPPDAALSDKFIAGGPGALFGAPNGVFEGEQGQPGYDLGTGMQGAGAYLMGISDPRALGALGAIKDKDTNDWAVTSGADGSMIRINKKTGQVERIQGGYSKAQEAYDTANAKTFADMNAEIPKNAAASQIALGDIGTMRDALSNPNVYQGAGGETAAGLKKLGAQFGLFDPKDVADADVAMAVSKGLALKARNLPGAGMPGAMSDADRKFLEQQVAGLNQSPEANQRLLDIYERLHKNAVALEGERQKYVAQNGRLDEGWNRHVQQYFQANPFDTSQKTYSTPRPGKTDSLGGTTKSGINWKVN